MEIRMTSRHRAKAPGRSARAPSHNPALVARPFMIENFVKLAHVDPTPARRALNEVPSLVLRFAVARFAEDRLGGLHRRPSNDVRWL